MLLYSKKHNDVLTFVQKRKITQLFRNHSGNYTNILNKKLTKISWWSYTSMNYTKCQQGIQSLISLAINCRNLKRWVEFQFECYTPNLIYILVASTLILDMLPTVYFQHTLCLINPNRVNVVCSFLIILQRVHHLF